MWRRHGGGVLAGSSSIYTALVSVTNLRCQHFVRLSQCSDHLLNQILQRMWGMLDSGEKVLQNGKSMFYQIKSDGQCVTLRPGQLTSTNGCTRLPVQADTRPSKSPPQTDGAWGATKNPPPEICLLPTSALPISLLH